MHQETPNIHSLIEMAAYRNGCLHFHLDAMNNRLITQKYSIRSIPNFLPLVGIST